MRPEDGPVQQCPSRAFSPVGGPDRELVDVGLAVQELDAHEAHGGFARGGDDGHLVQAVVDVVDRKGAHGHREVQVAGHELVGA